MSSDFSDGIELRAIAIASLKRSPTIPDVPTLAESGVKGAEADSWLAIFGPAGVPDAIVAKLNQEIAAVLHAEVRKWGEAVKRSGARVDCALVRCVPQCA